VYEYSPAKENLTNTALKLNDFNYYILLDLACFFAYVSFLRVAAHCSDGTGMSAGTAAVEGIVCQLNGLQHLLGNLPTDLVK
jgi:hypothetical protein